MNETPLVSLVMPCYNYGRYLPDCLAGIFAQEGYNDFEVIAIDDCSTDETRDILASYCDSRMRVIHHDVNRGHVYTVNEGFELARGQFVARIDPDDRYRPRFLKTLLPKFDEHPTVGMVYGDAAVINERGEITVPRCHDIHDGQPFCGDALLALLELNYICAPAAVARREAWQAALPIWDGLAFNDWYLNLMIARAYDLCHVAEVVADYRVHAQNHHTKIVANRSEEGSIRRVLDYVFSQPERTLERESRKQRFRQRAYAAQYLILAEKYFGMGYTADAQRCYWEVLRRQPLRALRPGPLRRLLGTYLGQERYEGVKRFGRRLRGWADTSPVEPQRQRSCETRG